MRHVHAAIVLDERAARNHAVAEGDALRSDVRIAYDGEHLARAQLVEGEVTACAGGLCGEAPVPELAAEEIAHLHAARALRGRGLNVYELSRRAENAEPGVTHLQADVTDEAQVNAAVAEILRREGRIDILINNAGFGISGAIEFTPAQEARRQFDVNFFGMVNMNRAVLPIMRQQGGGRIVNMSSVAAPIAIPFQAYYSASKAAVRTYSLALASEVRPFGVEVCVIMPGDIATGFTAARRKSCDGDDAYHGRIARSVAVMEHDEQTGMSAEYAGQFVARRATQKRAKLICTMGHKYALFVFLMRILPTGLATRIVGKIYAS